MKKQSAEFQKTKKRVAAALKAQLEAEREQQLRKDQEARQQKLKADRDAREQKKLAKAAQKRRLQKSKKLKREQKKNEREQKRLAALLEQHRKAQRIMFGRALVEGYAHELGKNLANLRIFDCNDEHDFAKARRWIRVARNFIEDFSDRFNDPDMFVKVRDLTPVLGQPGVFIDGQGRRVNIRDF